MEFLGDFHRSKGHSTTKLPLFDKSNYDYLKFKMIIYIKSTNTVVWKAIKEAYIGLTKLEGITMISKPENEQDEDDYKNKETHARAMNAIKCVVTPSQFKEISKCAKAKAMWNKLKVMYEGTNQVK